MSRAPIRQIREENFRICYHFGCGRDLRILSAFAIHDNNFLHILHILDRYASSVGSATPCERLVRMTEISRILCYTPNLQKFKCKTTCSASINTCLRIIQVVVIRPWPHRSVCWIRWIPILPTDIHEPVKV